MANNKLPDRASKLLRLALKDLASVEAEPSLYRVDMSVWFTGDPPPRRATDTGEWLFPPCEVCLAGAVMAMSLGADGSATLYASDFDPQTRDRLHALNWLRLGKIDRALFHLGLPMPDGLPIDAYVTPYERNPRAFRRNMEDIARKLERAGL